VRLALLKVVKTDKDKPHLFRLPYPILEFGSAQYGIHFDRIKFVQKNFLLLALKHLNWNANLILPSCSSRLLLINLPSLANRKTMLGTVFIDNLSRGGIDSPRLG